MNVVISGTSRGIGLALVRHALTGGHAVLGAARDPGGSDALGQLRARHGAQLRVTAADMRETTAAAQVAAAVRDWPAIDLLVNNAGILREGAAREDFVDSFVVNSVAPYELTQALLPQLQRSAHPRVVNITSKMGSITDNAAGGHYAYRASKAALNMINKTLACDHGWLTTVVVHPGWVQTDMGGVGAPVPLAESAAGIWRLIEGLQRADSGRFFDYQGQSLPW